MMHRLTFIAVAVLLLGAAAVLWRFTPLADLVTADRLTEWIGSFKENAWSPAAVIGVFVVAGLVVFPLTLLIAATAVVFDPAAAMAISFTGSLANAAVLYALGGSLIRGQVQKAFGSVVERLNRSLETRGIITVAVVRLLPVAPFSFVNLAAGSIGVRFRDYLIGTALGLAPGIILITAFGAQLRSLWEQPSPSNLAIVAGIVLAWIGLSLLLQRAASRWRQRRASSGNAAS